MAQVRTATEQDAEPWFSMRCALWPGDPSDHRREIERYFAGQFPRMPWEVFLAEEDDRIVGFVEVSERPYAEGCTSSPVAYLEGWYVRDEYRGSGIGRELVRAAEEWGSRRGHHEMASDCAPDNDVSAAAHRRLGFSDAGEIVCFFKPLNPLASTIRSPQEVVRAWVDAFNRADADELAELYAQDAVNHQVVQEPVVGREAIREMFRREFSNAEMHCVLENLFADGEWAILEWRDPQGLRGCGFFRVEKGRIVFQRGYWDQLSFLRNQGLPLPKE